MSRNGHFIKGLNQKWRSIYSSPSIRRLVKFGLVGSSGVLVNMGVFHLYLKLVQTMTGDVAAARNIFIAGLCGFAVSVFTNFSLNDLWTWGDRPKTGIGHYFRRLGKYYLASLTGGAIQQSTLMVLTTSFALSPTLGQGAGIVLGTGVNFLLSHFWAFRHNAPPAVEREPGI